MIKVSSLFATCFVMALANTSEAQTDPRHSWAHSCYAFKDMNRNGVFDIGDKPHAGLRIEMIRPDDTKTWKSSNIDGFANFSSSLDDDTHDVFEPGRHKVRAIFPDGWESLSETSVQEIEFVAQLNAGGRIVPVDTCRPIGVVPILELRGQIQPQGDVAPSSYSVRAINESEQISLDLPVGQNGNFLGIGKVGNWKLEVRNTDGKLVHERGFAVEFGAVRFSTIVPEQDPVRHLEGEWRELTFDDLLVADSLFEIPYGYGDLKFLNLIATHNRFYEGDGYVNNTISSEYIAYNSSGVPVPIWSDKPFDFKGTYVGVAWPRGEEDEVIFRAWRNDEMIYEDRLMLSHYGPIFFDANYKEITRMEISHANYERVVLDNFQYRFR